MRRSILALFLSTIVAPALFAQADPKAPAQPTTPAAAPGATSEYYPMKKGSKWVYKVNDIELTVQVGETTNGETKIDTIGSNGKIVSSEFLKVDATGIYRTKINNSPVEPPVKILELKDGKVAAKGAKWPVASKIQNQQVSGEFEIKDDKVALKVPAGDLTGVVYVEGLKLTVAGTETAVKQWFAPGKGIVKLSYSINGQEAVLELKSYEEVK